MKKTEPYMMRPATGQALLNYQNRTASEVVLPCYEAEIIEQVEGSSGDNYLLQGDCLSACAWLRAQKKTVDLVYIDPPFASGADYVKNIYLRNGEGEAIKKDKNSIGEEIMYGDIWQKEDYLNWMYERLLAIRTVMSENGSIYVHLGPNIGHYVKILMDEVFGEGNFVNEIIWNYVSGGIGKRNFAQKHDVIYFYSKDNDYVFNIQKERTKDYSNKEIEMDEKGEFTWYIRPNTNPDRPEGVKSYLDKYVQDMWQIPIVNPVAKERLGYPTQKPEALLERIIKASSNKGMLVADFFSGSGTTAKVAYDLGRQFVACDIGLNAIQTTRDRLQKKGAGFNIMKIKDGIRLFHNPTQTEKILSHIPGWQSATNDDSEKLWDGRIPNSEDKYIQVKVVGIDQKLTMQLVGAVLEASSNIGQEQVMIIYAYKENDVSQEAVNKAAKKYRRSDTTIIIKSFEEVLGDKASQLVVEDSADITVTQKGDDLRVKIRKFYSPYLSEKIAEHNERIQPKIGDKLKLKIKISDNGLELIDRVQFGNISKNGVWKDALKFEDCPSDSNKVCGNYTVPATITHIKIHNVAGDETIEELSIKGKK